jgi:hypothetical protein
MVQVYRWKDTKGPAMSRCPRALTHVMLRRMIRIQSEIDIDCRASCKPGLQGPAGVVNSEFRMQEES